MRDSTFTHRPDIDGLRAVAVLLVVLYHVGVPGITGGFVGVDVFFVISGFLITSLLVLEAETRGRISLSDFYARRVRRLFPALMVVVLVTLLLGAIWLLPVFGEQTKLAKSAIATSIYLSNFYFWKFTGNYFDGPAELEPLLHTWSLAVEEQFYLFWPLLIIGVVAFCRPDSPRFRRNVGLAMLVLLVLSLGVSVWSTENHPRAAYYLMPSRAWQFAVGGVLAVILPAEKNAYPRAGAALAALGLVLIVWSAMSLTSKSSFPGFNALAPTLGTAAVIGGGYLNQSSVAARVLTLRPMVFVGLLSYSWYLWHWPLLSITRASALQAHDLPRDALIGLVAFVAATITYYVVENPIRFKRPGPFAATRSTLWTGAAISVVTAVAAVGLAAGAKFVGSNQERYVAADLAFRDDPPLRKDCHYEEPFDGLADRSRCTFGDATAIEAILWGDSHADHLSGLMQAFVEKGPARGIMQRSFSSCRPFGSEAADILRQGDACMEFNELVKAEIAELRAKGMKGVVLSSMWSAVVGNDPLQRPSTASGQGPLTAAEKVELTAQALDRAVAGLEAEGLRILIVAPTHIMPRLVPQCLARHSVEDCSGHRDTIEALRQPAMQALRKVAASHPDSVRIWDPIDQLCDSRLCFAQRGGTIMFTDDLHITATAARQLLPAAEADLRWLIGQ